MMNERIKELLKQSQVIKEYKEFGAVRTEVDQEKFAELILKECMTLFENAKVNQEDDVDYGLEEAKNIIKECFGVEE